MRLLFLGFVAAVSVVSLNSSAHAASVTPEVIYGSGNSNGDFTVSIGDNVEIGLRGKIPFAGTTNYDGVKTYSFEAGLLGGSLTRPTWNFDFAVNVNADDNSNNSRSIGDLTYLLSLDVDPTAGEDFAQFSLDPFNLAFADHSFGNNNTLNGQGVEATTAAEYNQLLTSNNVVQQSWSYGFFPLTGFDPLDIGLYTINLEVFDGGTSLAKSSININVSAVPIPAALPLLMSALGMFGFFGWRRKRKIAATA